jgi:hypothetical protein
MSALKYSWSRRFAMPAQQFGEFYYSLKKRTPEELVRAAKSARSPVHKLFNWDDRVAAHEHRLLQARVMVNSLQVEIVTPKGKPGNVIAFLRSSTLGRDVPLHQAKPEDITASMQKCWLDMLRFKRRYKNLEIAQQVILAIDDIDRRLRRSQKKAA